MGEAHGGYAMDAAAGVDGVTTAQYEADWEANLTKLLERYKSDWYRAPAVRRLHDGEAGDGEDAPHRDTDAGGQGASACGADGCWSRWMNGTLRRDSGAGIHGELVSPLPGNLYLHEVVDRRFEHEVKPWHQGARLRCVTPMMRCCRSSTKTMRDGC